MKTKLITLFVLALIFYVSLNGSDLKQDNSNPVGFSFQSPTRNAEGVSFGVLPDTTGCTYKGFKLYGKVKIVDAFPDIKVKVVESFPDLKVKVVDNWPDDCGKWEFVDSFPDLKIQFVESFPDVKIKFVDNWPGKP